MFHSKKTRVIAIFALFFLCALSTLAQRVRGELHLEVHDPHGTAVSPIGELVSKANGFRRTFVAGPEGRYVAQDLPFGVYRLSLQAEGFAPWSDLVEIRSEVPVRVAVTPGVAPVTTQVQVNDSATLVDPYATGSLYSIGRQAIEEHDAAQPGRELLNLVAERSEEHTSELQSRLHLVCRLLLEKKKIKYSEAVLEKTNVSFVRLALVRCRDGQIQVRATNFYLD